MKKILLFTLLTVLNTIAYSQTSFLSIGDVQKLSLHGFAQANYDYTNNAGKETNDFNFKHVVLIADASLTERLSFRLMADMASPQHLYLLLQEYYAQYTFAPWLKVRMGQFKTPYTIENVMPPTLIGALNTNSSVCYMAGVVSDPLYGLMTGRDQGIMLSGEVLHGSDGHALMSYSVGLFNGAGVNQRDNNRSKDLVAMLNIIPIKEVQLTASCIIGRGTARNDSPFSGITSGEEYRRNRWSAGVKAHYERITFRGEWMGGVDGNTPMCGGYAELWIRTLPKLDVVLDIDYLNRNSTLDKEQQKMVPQATQTTNYMIGLQYWIYRNCRIATQYVHTASPSAPTSHLWATQVQMAF